MKLQFPKFTLNDGMKQRSGALLAALVVTVGISGTLSACGAANATSSASTGNSSAQTSSPSLDVKEAWVQTADEWASAVKSRDGKAQYALMSPDLQESIYDDFAGLNWVTGTSSPWVESYTVQESDTGVQVIFNYATSTGPAGSYRQDLTFQQQDGGVKISAISDPVQIDNQTTALSFSDLIGLLGMTQEQVTAAMGETPVGVDEGGLGFEGAGIRVWFDDTTHTKVAQVLIMTDTIDLNGVHMGDSYSDFEKVFGEPISDRNGDAHFKYDNVYLSVVRDISTDSDKTIGVYILQEDF